MYFIVIINKVISGQANSIICGNILWNMFYFITNYYNHLTYVVYSLKWNEN